MVKMSAVYVGEKRCEATHGPSGTKIETDAPKDNNGKGEAFSPTDLVGTALGTCMLTTMAIHWEKEGISFEKARVTVEKEMTSTPPRKIAKLNVVMHLPQSIPHEFRKKVENSALHCPVHASLSSDVQMPITFHYDM